MQLPEIRRILYCTDLSETAKHAFGYALALARDTGAEIHLLHAVEDLSPDAKVTLQAYLQDMDGPGIERILSDRAKDVRAVIERRKEELWKASDDQVRDLHKRLVSINVEEGYPAEVILKMAGAKKCDLILMGTHEKGPVQAFLGSVAKTVMRASRIPVLVVPLP